MCELVSIIMPTYNCGKYIERTIQSVQEQTYPDWEIIVVDDCSKDNTYEVVSRMMEKDNRIKYHRLEENSGAAVARNKAMEYANGVYMAFLDSDDLWDAQKIEKQLIYMKDNKINISCTAYEQIDEKDVLIGKLIKPPRRIDYNRLLLDCPVGNSSVMYNVQALGKFEIPNIRKRNDDALWLKMLKKEKYIFGMQDVLMKYRVRDNSISSNKISLIKYHWELYRRIEHLSIARSVFHVLVWCFIKIFKIK